MPAITDLNVLTTVVAADLLLIVDVGDDSMAASGTDKQITVADLLAGCVPYSGATGDVNIGPNAFTAGAGISSLATSCLGGTVYVDPTQIFADDGSGAPLQVNGSVSVQSYGTLYFQDPLLGGYCALCADSGGSGNLIINTENELYVDCQLEVNGDLIVDGQLNINNLNVANDLNCFTLQTVENNSAYFTAAALPAPDFTLTKNGTGSTAYHYVVVPVDDRGNSGTPSSYRSISNAATLSDSNSNTITISNPWLGYSAFAFYVVYRVRGGATQGAIGAIVEYAGTWTLTDNGLVGDGTSVPASTEGVVTCNRAVLTAQSTPPAAVAGGLYFSGTHFYGCLNGSTWTQII
jgi:hypothetical protein